MLASFIGLGVIRRVSRLLHTPLMSLTNAISAIAVVGSILMTGGDHPLRIRILGAIALFASMTNIVSGFLITDRMLKMFKTERASATSGRRHDLRASASSPTSSRRRCFIFALHWMNTPATARNGVYAGVAGHGARGRRHLGASPRSFTTRGSCWQSWRALPSACRFRACR